MKDDPPVLSWPPGKTVVHNLFDVAALARSAEWRPFRAGIEILPLYGEQQGADSLRASAALLRYRAGASVPLHEHLGYEHVVVLEGSQRDAQGTYERGAFVISEPGSRHSVTSDDGCIVLVLWNRPVAFVPPDIP
jgi:anti-sigma factor ChrR (cupin superfamily)